MQRNLYTTILKDRSVALDKMLSAKRYEVGLERIATTMIDTDKNQLLPSI